MKKSRRKRIVRRRRRISEKEIMRIKRKLKKSARKLRLGAKRTGAYVYGTLRRIRGNPATTMSDIYRISEKINSEGGRVRVEQAGGGGLNLYVDRVSPYDNKTIDRNYEYLLRGTKKEVYEALIRIRFVDKYRPYATQIPLRTARAMVRAGLPLRRGELRGNPSNLSAATYPPERALIMRLARANKWRNFKATRKSIMPYDIRIEGVQVTKMGDLRFSADLKLSAISTFTNWPSPEIAMMSDYPSMVMEGDWSGIRDSSDEAISRIFYHTILKPSKRGLRKNPAVPQDWITHVIFQNLMKLKKRNQNEEMIEDVAVIPRPKHPGDFVVRVKHRYYVDGRRVYSAGLKTADWIESSGVAIIGHKQKRVGSSDYVYNFYGVRRTGFERPRKGSLFDNRIR